MHQGFFGLSDTINAFSQATLNLSKTLFARKLLRTPLFSLSCLVMTEALNRKGWDEKTNKIDKLQIILTKASESKRI